MAFSIIMLACLIVCVGIDYLSLKRIDQNGALLGVTLPPDAAALPEVQSIVQQYLRWLRIICLLCAAGGVGLFFLPDSLLRVMVWVYFFFGSLALPGQLPPAGHPIHFTPLFFAFTIYADALPTKTARTRTAITFAIKHHPFYDKQYTGSALL